MLSYLIESVRQCSYPGSLIVATSEEETDRPVALLCEQKGVECYRGNLNNVASRYYEIISDVKYDAFVRICGDSPLLDYRLIDIGVDVFLRRNWPDMVTNVMPRSFPKGQSVEVINARSYAKVYSAFKEKDELEHVTQYFYEHKEEFEVVNFKAQKDYSKFQLSVDEKEDFARFLRIVESLPKEHWEYGWEYFVERFYLQQ